MTGLSSLRDVLVAHERAQPESPLLLAPETGHCLSYGQFAREARQLAARLEACRLKPGDHVGFLLHNGYQTTALFLGTMVAGMVVTPLNLLSIGAQLAYVLSHSDVKLVLRRPSTKHSCATRWRFCLWIAASKSRWR